MSIKILFLDNETYGADDINNALSLMTRQGIAPFAETGTTLNDLNNAIADMTSSGVEMYNVDACKVVKSGNIYQIMPGTAWMHDGSSITIEDDAETISVASGVAQFVYFEKDVGMNTINIVVSAQEAPANTVPLARISADGTVTDTRTFAVTKVAPNSANLFHTIQTPTFQVSQYTDQSVPVYTIDLGSSWAKHVMISKENGIDVVGCCMALEDGVRTISFKPTLNGSSFPRLSFLKRGQYLDIFAAIAGVGTLNVSYEIIIC